MTCCTVCKFNDFPITQILRETNFGDFRSAKSATLTHSESLNFDFYEVLHFLKSEIYQINIIQRTKSGKNCNFRPSKFPKLISQKKNLSDRKIMKFPHCVLILNIDVSMKTLRH